MSVRHVPADDGGHLYLWLKTERETREQSGVEVRKGAIPTATKVDGANPWS